MPEPLEPITKREAISLLRRGLADPQEVATMAGRSRQIVRHWALAFPGARSAYLERIHRGLLGSRISRPDGNKKPPPEVSALETLDSGILAPGEKIKAPSRKTERELI